MLFRSAKEIALAAVMTALLLAAQFALAAVQGVEIVTVLFLSYCVAFGARRGMVVAVSFSLIRCFLYGFFPNVVLLYLIYYTLFALVTGWTGRLVCRLPSVAQAAVLAGCAAAMTCCFTLLDDLLTPWMLGYSQKSAQVYFYASLPVMAVQAVCAAATVALLWIPLSKAFSSVRTARSPRRKPLAAGSELADAPENGVAQGNAGAQNVRECRARRRVRGRAFVREKVRGGPSASERADEAASAGAARRRCQIKKI